MCVRARSLSSLLSCSLCAALSLLGCEQPRAPTTRLAPAASTTSGAAALHRAHAVPLPRAKLAFFSPLPSILARDTASVSDAKIALGKKLFFDPRLSKGRDLSCNSCHTLERYGVDGHSQNVTAQNVAAKGAKLWRNTPSVFHAAGQVAAGWDGRSADVEEQARAAFVQPIEMGQKSIVDVERALRAIPGYLADFQAAFPSDKQPVTVDNAARAIAAFERRLTTPGRFDRLLLGDDDALTDDERAGLLTFVDVGCVRCHGGALLGGASLQRIGAVTAWPSDKLNDRDPGRFDVTRNEADRLVFKVPSLRNVEKTGPYLHDGSLSSLAETVQLMARHELGRELSVDENTHIVAFLGALTGDLPTEVIAPPTLPDDAPKPSKADAR